MFRHVVQSYGQARHKSNIRLCNSVAHFCTSVLQRWIKILFYVVTKQKERTASGTRIVISTVWMTSIQELLPVRGL
jgi:hypothetical protein